MKATRQHDTFKPIVLTLETQQEVDAIYAFLCHSPLSDVVGLEDQYEALTPFATNKYQEYIQALTKATQKP